MTGALPNSSPVGGHSGFLDREAAPMCGEVGWFRFTLWPTPLVTWWHGTCVMWENQDLFNFSFGTTRWSSLHLTVSSRTGRFGGSIWARKSWSWKSHGGNLLSAWNAQPWEMGQREASSIDVWNIFNHWFQAALGAESWDASYMTTCQETMMNISPAPHFNNQLTQQNSLHVHKKHENLCSKTWKTGKPQLSPHGFVQRARWVPGQTSVPSQVISNREWIITGCTDGSAATWDANTGEWCTSLFGHDLPLGPIRNG